MADDATLVDENNYTNLPEKPEKPSNVANIGQLKRGDVEQGFELADIVIEREYKVPMAHQGILNPMPALQISMKPAVDPCGVVPRDISNFAL